LNSPKTYDFDVSVCDVLDKESLQAFREKHQQWRSWMRFDPEHSVWKQIGKMLWNDVVFRSINEARRLAMENHWSAACLNGPLARFIDHGYVVSQVLSVRRLTDRPHKGTRPGRQVVSLGRVLDDLTTHRQLITREHYVAHDGLPYDFEAVRDRFFEAAARAGGVQPDYLDTKGPNAFDMARTCHESFDRLSGVSAENRRRNDLIRPEVLEALSAAIDKSGYGDVVEYGNKFIAHAADEHSRSSLSEDQRGITLQKITECYMSLCQVAQAISSIVLWDCSHGLVPTPQYDPFEHLDEPWLPREGVVSLIEIRKELVANVEAWTGGDQWDGFLRSITDPPAAAEKTKP